MSIVVGPALMAVWFKVLSLTALLLLTTARVQILALAYANVPSDLGLKYYISCLLDRFRESTFVKLCQM